MMTLPPDARQKLTKILGLTNSTHDGEALSAARLANDLLKRHGATWEDALLALSPDSERDSLDHARRARWTLENGHCALKPKEKDFLSNIITRRVITAKQREWLGALQSRVEGWNE